MVNHPNRAVMNGASALVLYDRAVTIGAEWEAAAHALAAVLRKLKAAKVKTLTGFEMTAASLSRAFSLLCKVTERRNTIPILSQVHMRASGDVLTLTASDLDMHLSIDVSAPGIGAWEACAPAYALASAFNNGDGPVTFERTEGAWTGKRTGQGVLSLSVQIGSGCVVTSCLPPSDFPIWDKKDKPVSWTMPGANLASLLAFAQPAISSEETRYYLNGVWLHTVKVDGAPKLRAVATDGHRLHCADLDAPEGLWLQSGRIIPRKTVTVLLAFLTGSASLSIGELWIECVCGPIRLRAKTIDGAYPDYARVIPADNQGVYSISRAHLVAALKRVVAQSVEKSAAVRFTWTSSGVTLRVKDHDGGKAEESVACEHRSHIAESTSFEIGMNGRYALDQLAALGGDVVTFRFGDPASPVLATSDASADRLAVVMPLRV